MKNHILKYGLILGAVQVIITLIMYLVDIELFMDWKVGILSMVISLSITVYAGTSYKKMQGGFLSLKEGFLVVWGVFIASSFVALAFRLLLFNVIDPELAVYLQERTVETTVEMMERFGAPESSIDETVEQLESNNQFSPANMLMGFIWSTLIGAIVAIIIAAIIKKNKPPFEEQSEA